MNSTPQSSQNTIVQFFTDDFWLNLRTSALIWMTAGEAIRRVLPDHVPIAERGIWQRADYPTIKPALDTAWMPYLKGSGTRDDALLAVMKLVGR